MSPRRQGQFKLIEQKKLDILRRLESATLGQQEGLPPQKLAQDAWSPMQIAYHLMRAEELLPAPPDGSVARRKPIFFLGCAMLRAAVPIPSKAREEPRDDISLEELLKRWSTSRETLQAGLETAKPGERFANHPVFGALDADSYLTMLDAHLTYHLKRWPA